MNRLRARMTNIFGHQRDRDIAQSKEPERVQVLFVNGCDISVPHPTRFRVYHQIEQLRQLGYTADAIQYSDVAESIAERADVFIFFRCPITDGIENAIRVAHEKGKTVLFDVDDLVTSTEYTDGLSFVQDLSAEEKAIFDDGIMRNGETLKLCDGAVVSTERLAKELGQVVPKVLVNRNVASLEMLELSERAVSASRKHDDGIIKLGYFSGSHTHDDDFKMIVEPVGRIFDNYENVDLVIVGSLIIPEELKAYEGRIEIKEAVDWKGLPSLISDVDIALAPLEDSIFNEAKSENRWIESSLVRVPTVASKVGAFETMIRDGETGFLCSTKSDWEDNLSRLIENAELRREMGAHAYDFCLKNCITATTGYKLSSRLSDEPLSIEDIVPKDESAREIWMRAFKPEEAITSAVIDASEDSGDVLNLEPFDARLQNLLKAHSEGMGTAVFIYERRCGDDATFRYFGLNVAEALANSKRWHGELFFTDELGSLAESADSMDCAVLIRCRIRPEIIRFLDCAKRGGIKSAYLIDDNVFGPQMRELIALNMSNDKSSEFEHDFWVGVCKRMELAAIGCDALIAPSGHFSKMLEARFAKPSLVISHSLNKEQIAIAGSISERQRHKEETEGNRFTVGYFPGTSSHQEDFRQVSDALLRFLSIHENADLLLVGCLEIPGDFMPLLEQNRVTVLPKVDCITLQALQAYVSVALAPLVVDDFTNCKGPLKVFEAGAAGTPVCASPSFSYIESIEDGVSGFICKDEKDWISALETLINDRGLLHSMSEEAYRLAMENYQGEGYLRQVEDALDALSECNHSGDLSEPLEALTLMTAIEDWDNPFDVNPRFS